MLLYCLSQLYFMAVILPKTKAFWRGFFGAHCSKINIWCLFNELHYTVKYTTSGLYTVIYFFLKIEPEWVWQTESDTKMSTKPNMTWLKEYQCANYVFSCIWQLLMCGGQWASQAQWSLQTELKQVGYFSDLEIVLQVKGKARTAVRFIQMRHR